MNVVAWRLPRGMDPLKGRSVCPQCGHTLGAPDLVPVFSWLFLRGRCRHCGAHIPARYLLVELLGGVLALVRSLLLFASAPMNAVVNMGLSLVCMALGGVLAGIGVAVVQRLVPWVFGLIGRLAKWVSGKVGGRR